MGAAAWHIVSQQPTEDEQLVQNLIEGAKRNFEKENETKNNPYQLLAAMGYATSDLKAETMADFMNRITVLTIRCTRISWHIIRADNKRSL